MTILLCSARLTDGTIRMDDLGDQEDLRKARMANAFPTIPQKSSNMSYFKRPFDVVPQLSMESPTSGRRPRADTMPSQSTAFPYTPTNLDLSPSRPTPMVSSRQRSGSVTHSSPLGPSMFRSSWIDMESNLSHPPSLQSPSSDILDEERSGTIASTMATLGLDDDKDMRSNDSLPSSTSSYHHAALQSRPNSMGADGLSTAHHLLMNHSNTIRSRAYTTSATAQLPTRPDIFLQTSQQSAPSRFQPFAPTSNRPRAISLGMADATIEGPTVTPTSRDSVVTPGSLWPTDLARQRGLRGSTSSGNLSNLASGHHDFGANNDRFMPSIRNDMSDQWTDELYHNNSRLFDTSGSTQATASAQTPTRSLWFGNVDPALTVPELIQIFSPYGPIESARVLPDKECAFVNFVDLDDALRAKDDFGSNLASSLGGSFVKVGFGKPEVATAASSNSDMNNTVQGPTRALCKYHIPKMVRMI